MGKKMHYRKVFKSDHLGVADLEDFLESGSSLIFTITEVKQEFGVTVAGRRGDFNIAYFAEDIKPWVLNAGNSKVMRKLCGGSAYIDDWIFPVTVRLYIDPSAKLKGEVVGGVRVSPEVVRQAKKELVPGNTVPWENAIAAYKRDGDFAAVEKRMIISDENKQLIIEQASASE